MSDMNKAEISTDAPAVYAKLMELSFKETKRAIKTALTKSAQKLVKDTRSNLKASFKNTNKLNPKYNDTLQKGVRKQKVKVEEHDVWTKVRVHSTNKHGSGSFRLPMLEGGTADRYVKTRAGKPLRKPAFRGHITGGFFFKQAVSAGNYSNQEFVYSELDKAINKINKKKLND